MVKGNVTAAEHTPWVDQEITTVWLTQKKSSASGYYGIDSSVPTHVLLLTAAGDG